MIAFTKQCRLTVLQVTSTRDFPSDLSSVRLTFSSFLLSPNLFLRAAEYEGQPLPESNFVSELNNVVYTVLHTSHPIYS